MFNKRMILITIGIFACLLAQTHCNVQYPNLDEETGCPINVAHVCEFCAEDQNRFGCYCDLGNNNEFVTANIFTPCPSQQGDPCANNNCQNGATCVQKSLTEYRCECPLGFTGELCNVTLAKCSDTGIDCPNAECVETNNPLMPVYCQCYDGTRRDPRTNATCPLSPCYEPGTENAVCKNNGTCRIVNSAYLCECAAGWAGQNCTAVLKTPLCESDPNVCGVGRCIQSLTPPYYSCNCGIYPSTFGKTLTALIKCENSACYASNPCLNGGTCSNKADGTFYCQCTSRFTGTKCEKNSACFTNPCLNNGVCQAFNETVYFCTCPPGFTGQRCETVIPDPCKSKSCGLYGVCISSQGVAVCNCSDGIHPDNIPCQNPCLNFTCGPGVCTTKVNASNVAVCSCPPSRKGDRCQLPTDPCREAPRCGGGYCKPSYSAPRGYVCVCEGGIVRSEPCPFSATCPITTCGTDGICVESDGIIVPPSTKPIYYVCSCKQGYITLADCNDLLATKVNATTTICGTTSGRPYPSRDPTRPIGCFCNNGTHIEVIPNGETGPLCV